MKRNLCIGLLFVVVLALLLAASSILQKRAAVEAAGVQAPRFEVDPMWPKPLPNHWIQGNTIGVSVDSKDHIWIIHRAGSLEAMETYAATNRAECCKPAPAVLEFDEEGNLLNSWGGDDGPGYEWPASNHGITVDYKGNVWIGGNGRTANAPATAESAGNAAPGAAAAKQAKAAPGRGGPPHYHDSMVLKFTQEGKFLM